MNVNSGIVNISSKLIVESLYHVIMFLYGGVYILLMSLSVNAIAFNYREMILGEKNMVEKKQTQKILIKN